jgi:glyoxylase-like metal-dependent hydrolase (beta-lactamase superfamily II)
MPRPRPFCRLLVIASWRFLMVAQFQDPIKILARHAGDIRIHTFISSFANDNIANATHIIESETRLVLVDSQFLVPYARQFREYADSLGKPIDRLYLSHRHPDHWFGSGAAFSDIPIYALAETQSFLQEHGEDFRKDYSRKDLVPDRVVVPQEIVEPGEETVDGVKYIFSKVTNTESDFALTIGLPEIGVYFLQDLLYSGTHPYLTKFINNWIRVLQDLLISDYDLFMPGHGLPADKNEVARNVEYLSAASEAIGNGLTHDDFKNFLLQRYPERKCPGVFDFYLAPLFDNARDLDMPA